jgi:FlaA1/EpsC-like NDP-sugar epimerase
VASRLASMSRLRNPSHLRRAQQFAADAALAALAFALAFKLRFLDVAGGIPERYEDMLVGSIAFVAIGQALVFDLFGQHQKWWRYFRLPDLWPLVRAAIVAVALLVVVFAIAQPYADDLPRSVVVFDFLLLTGFTGGARLLRRSIAERSTRISARGRSASSTTIPRSGGCTARA